MCCGNDGRKLTMGYPTYPRFFDPSLNFVTAGNKTPHVAFGSSFNGVILESSAQCCQNCCYQNCSGQAGCIENCELTCGGDRNNICTKSCFG